ncbi:protein rep, partial [Escherichia coli]
GKSYVKHARWVELWRECLRVSYDPNVDVRAVKPRKPKDGESLACATAELVRGAVAETLKYSTKPADMVADPEWFLELTRQTHKRRFVATGGALKDVLKLDQETDADMVIGDDISEGDDDGSRIAFEWKIEVKKYRRSPTKDKTESE